MATGFEGKFALWLRSQGTQPFAPLLRNQAGHIILCCGTVVPSEGVVGFADGAAFLKTSPTQGDLVLGIYSNIGTADACVFDRVG
jgi:hypothetical protein